MNTTDVITAPSAEQTPTAVPSPAPENHQEVLNSLTPAQRTKWQMTGELPTKADPAPAKESSDAPPKEQAESAPAPDAGKEQEKPAKRKLNAEERIAQLEATIAKIREQSGKDSKAITTQPAAPSTAKPVEAKPEPLKEPKEPQIEEYSGPDAWDKYDKDYRKWVKDTIAYNREKAIEDFRIQAQEQAQQQKLSQELAEGRKRYDDFDQVVAPAYQRVMTENLDPTVLAMVGNSPLFVDLLYALGEPSALEDFIQTAKTNPYQAIRKVVIMEGLIHEELSKKATDKGQNLAPEKKITSAPNPPTEVSGKNTAPGDEVEAAVKRGDFTAYYREMNRRELAAKKAN